MSDLNDDSAKYAAMAQELNEADRAEGIDREPISVGSAPSGGNLGGQDERAYDPAQDGVPAHQPAQPQYQPQPHQPQHQLPDVYDDPIGHFAGRMQELESVALGTMDDSSRRDFVSNVERSERLIRNEVPDYDDACLHLEQGRIDELNKAFPDNNHQAQVLAHQQGFQSAAHMKEALLNRDRISVADWAARNGRSPAEVYYQLAAERGYRPRVAARNSTRRELGNVLKNARGNQFDEAWRYYERLAKREDELARGQR